MPATEYASGRAEILLATVDDTVRQNLGRDTYQFVKRIMDDPNYKEQIDTYLVHMRATALHARNNQEAAKNS